MGIVGRFKVVEVLGEEAAAEEAAVKEHAADAGEKPPDAGENVPEGFEVIDNIGLKRLSLDMMRQLLKSNPECKLILRDEEKAREDRDRQIAEGEKPNQVQAWDIEVKGRLFKMDESAGEDGGNQMDDQHWRPRDTWVKDDGKFWYHSEKERKDLLYFNGTPVGLLEIVELAEGSIPCDFGFSIGPPKAFKMMHGVVTDIEVAPARFGTDDEDLYNSFIECFNKMLEKAKEENPSSLGSIKVEEE